jgi:Uma2 family endonuclease
MTSTALRKLTFVDFLEQHPDDGIYELVNGEIVKVEAIRAHKNVSRFLMFGFNDEIRRLGLDYIVDKDIVIRTCTNKGEQRGRNPDVSLGNRNYFVCD